MKRIYVYILWASTVVLIPLIASAYPRQEIKYIFATFLFTSCLSGIYLFKTTKRTLGKMLALIAAIVFGLAVVASVLALR